MSFLKYFSIAALCLTAFLVFGKKQGNLQMLEGNTFGTYYRIKIASRDKDTSLRGKIQKIFDEVNQKMSVFEPASELNEINRAPAGQKINVSRELYNILQTSKEVYEKSGGRFDPSVEPLIELWGFGINKKHLSPNDKKIKKTLEYCGFDKIRLSEQTNAVSKKHDKTTLNLSAIAKGYAVDRVAELLRSLGYKDFLVDIGGEVYASGRKNKRTRGWNVGIAHPAPDSRKNMFIIELQDMAVATSGDYRNFFTQNGKRYSHAISPQTGRPAEHNLASVTVFNPSCMLADAYATAILTAGEEEGLALANKQNIAAVLFVRTPENTIDVRYSQATQKNGMTTP